MDLYKINGLLLVRLVVIMKTDNQNKGENRMNKILKKALAVGLVFAMLLIPFNGIEQVSAKSVKITSIKRQTPPFYTSTVARGKSLYLRPKIAPAYADNQDLKWTTSNSRIASVNQNGKVTGVKNGTVTVRASAMDGSKKYISWKITVGTPSTKVNVDQVNLSLRQGASGQITATVSPAKASNKKMSYATSNIKIATVSTKGIVTAVAEGSCKITVWAADGRSKNTVQVTVEKGIQPKNNIRLTKADVKGSVIALSNETIDNLYIDNSVGTVQIMLYNVTIKDTLYMSDGALYTVDTNLCNIESVQALPERVFSTKQISIKSAIGPTLAIKENTKVGSVEVSANVNISRIGTGTLSKLTIVDAPSTAMIMCSITGYNGNLIMNTEHTGVTLDLLNCQIDRMETRSTLALSEAVSGSSQVKTLTLDGKSVICDINMPVTDLYINNGAVGLGLNLSKSVTNLYNNGSQSRIFISAGVIDKLQTSGMTALINGMAGAKVNNIFVDGAATSIVMAEAPLKITAGVYATNSTYNYQLLEPGKSFVPPTITTAP